MPSDTGCATEQIKAITEHQTDQMATYYSKQVNQKVLAMAAIDRMEKIQKK